MDQLRRLYLYGIAGLTLALLVGALITLLNIAVEGFLEQGGRMIGLPSSDGSLSLPLAMAVVALPIWALHWGKAERIVRGDDPRAVADRTSAIRALLLSLVLSFLLTVLTASGTVLLVYLLKSIFIARTPDQSGVGAALASLLVAGAFWAYHALVRWHDIRMPMTGAAAWLPRLYRYLAAWGGLTAMLVGISGLLAIAVSAAVRPAGLLYGSGATTAAETLAPIVLGLLIWAIHWSYSNRLLDWPDWRAASERASLLRRLYYLAVILLGAGGAALVLALALASALQAIDAPALAQSIAFGLILAAVWWAHRRSMIAEAGRLLGAAAQLSARRLDGYAVALVGLTALTAGLSGLFWLTLSSTLFARSSFFPGRALAEQAAGFAGFAVVGALIWLAQIWIVARWRRTDAAAESSSTARRAYLFAGIGGSLVVVIGSLIVLLNEAVTKLLLPRGQASDLGMPGGLLIVAVLTGALHYWWLRRDKHVTAAAVAVAAELPTPAAPAAQLPLILTAPAGGDATIALNGLRAQLPEGYRLDLAD